MCDYQMKNRGVAQLASAPDWGSGGQRFESARPDCNAGLYARKNYAHKGLHYTVFEIKPSRCKLVGRCEFI